MGCITSGNSQTCTNALTFHFAGIKAPKSRQTTLNISEKVPIITIRSSLHANDTILNLKKLIHKIYKIPSDNDILILYSHIIISNDNDLTLQDFNITDNSLLFLAIKTQNDIDISSLTSITVPDNNSNILSPPPITLTNFNLRRMRLRNRHRRAPPLIDTTLIHNIDDLKMDNSDSDTDTDDEKINTINYSRHNIPQTLRLILPSIRTPSPPVPPLRRISLTLPNNILMTESMSPPLRSIPRFTLESQLESPSPSISMSSVSTNTTQLHSHETPIFATLPSLPTIKPSLHEMKINVHSHSNNLSPTNSMTQSDDDDDDILSLQPIKGFDIITQEHNVLGYKMPTCAHFMNKESLYEYALNMFTDCNNVCLQCPHSLHEQKYDNNVWPCAQCTFINSIDRLNCEICFAAKSRSDENMNQKQICGAKWEWSVIKKVLMTHKEKGAVTIQVEQQYIDRLSKLELLSARNKIEKECNVQKCPQCETLYCAENTYEHILGHTLNAGDVEKIFKTKCELCKDVSFCWGCGVEWSLQHFCDASFRNELIEILSGAETKKIGEVDGVPAIRCCPNCCQLIYHSEACKHMKCKGCKTDFCFVCMKVKKDGNWQCGSHSDICTVAERQNVKTLPDSIIINKKAFQLF